jgi:hypothetical protein
MRMTDSLADELMLVGVGYTIATGRLFCDMKMFQKTAEAILGRPLMTHEFADPAVWVELRSRFESLVSEKAA